MRKSLVLAMAALSTAGVAAFVPATADAASTNVTFTLNGGSLSLSAPASATLAAGTLAVTGTSVTGQLGSVTVTDNRGQLGHVDTVNMSSTDFTDSASDTVSASGATGSSGAATPAGSFAATVPTLTGQALAGAGSTILQLTGVLGSASVTYNPTVTVTIPANSIAGTYTGTVTQTVS